MSSKAKMRLEVVAVVLSVGLVAGGVLFLSGSGTQAAPGEKNVICHYVGHLGDDRYHRIECGSGCVNGHFDNQQQPLAGHEQDVLNPPGGVCPDAEPSPDPSPDP